MSNDTLGSQSIIDLSKGLAQNLKCGYALGFCLNCEENKIRAISNDHLIKKTNFIVNGKIDDAKASINNILALCSTCNSDKGILSASIFFTAEKFELAKIIVQIETTETERFSALIQYIETLLELSKDLKKSFHVSGKVISLLNVVQIRKHFKNFDFTDCRFATKQTQIDKLSKHYDLNNARIFISE